MIPLQDLKIKKNVCAIILSCIYRYNPLFKAKYQKDIEKSGTRFEFDYSRMDKECKFGFKIIIAGEEIYDEEYDEYYHNEEKIFEGVIKGFESHEEILTKLGIVDDKYSISQDFKTLETLFNFSYRLYPHTDSILFNPTGGADRMIQRNYGVNDRGSYGAILRSSVSHRVRCLP